MVKLERAWNITCSRYVAFLDIMGFKDMVTRSNQRYVESKLDTFQYFLNELNKDAINTYYSQKRSSDSIKAPRHTAIKPVVFSDSIILISNDDSIASALAMLYNVGWVIALSIHSKIPLKGAIAHGEQTADFEKSIHFGIPLIDAYELQDEFLSYGVILHYTMENRLHIYMNDINKSGNILYRYRVPMKTGKIMHYVVNWTMFPNIDKNLEKFVIELYNTVSGSPRMYVDNTLEFVREIQTRKAELE